MPYRGDPGQVRCSYCGEQAAHDCRLCGRDLCVEHALVATFYVPTAECVPASRGGRCSRPRGRVRRQAHRAKAIAQKLAAAMARTARI